MAAMTDVDWFNQRRLHGKITSDATYTIPAEANMPSMNRNNTPQQHTATTHRRIGNESRKAAEPLSLNSEERL